MAAPKKTTKAAPKKVAAKTTTKAAPKKVAAKATHKKVTEVSTPKLDMFDSWWDNTGLVMIHQGHSDANVLQAAVAEGDSNFADFRKNSLADVSKKVKNDLKEICRAAYHA